MHYDKVSFVQFTEKTIISNMTEAAVSYALSEDLSYE